VESQGKASLCVYYKYLAIDYNYCNEFIRSSYFNMRINTDALNSLSI